MNSIGKSAEPVSIRLLGSPFWKPFVPTDSSISMTVRPFFTDKWVSAIELVCVYCLEPLIVIANLLDKPLVGKDLLETVGSGPMGRACVLNWYPSVLVPNPAMPGLNKAPVRPYEIPGRSTYPNAAAHGDGDPGNPDNWVIAVGAYSFFTEKATWHEDDDFRGGLSLSVGGRSGPGIAFSRTNLSYSFSVVADLDAYLASFQNQVFADTNLGVLAGQPTIFQSGNGKIRVDATMVDSTVPYGSKPGDRMNLFVVVRDDPGGVDLLGNDGSWLDPDDPENGNWP
jgi:hypothetical protein